VEARKWRVDFGTVGKAIYDFLLLIFNIGFAISTRLDATDEKSGD
jgi:hypothetical protein